MFQCVTDWSCNMEDQSSTPSQWHNWSPEMALPRAGRTQFHTLVWFGHLKRKRRKGKPKKTRWMPTLDQLRSFGIKSWDDASEMAKNWKMRVSRWWKCWRNIPPGILLHMSKRSMWSFKCDWLTWIVCDTLNVYCIPLNTKQAKLKH